VSTRRRLVIAVAAACLVAGCAAGAAQPHAPVAAETHSAAPTTQQLSGPQPIPAKTVVTPIRVAIPAIGVRQSALEALTRDPGTGELRPPVDFTKVGYYREGPAPGDPGPAVLAGHVDDTTGPKVFFRLRELKAGDQVTVTRSDGKGRALPRGRGGAVPQRRVPHQRRLRSGARQLTAAHHLRGHLRCRRPLLPGQHRGLRQRLGSTACPP